MSNSEYRAPFAWRRLVVVFALPLLVSCGSATGPSDTAQATRPVTDVGFLAGAVMRTATSGAATPVAGAVVVVTRAAGGEPITTLTTGADGAFDALLPVGAYVVTMGGAPALPTNDLPATISVTLGQTTTLTVRVR
jgi:Carboxypeptidase regulatory-like domain